MEFARPNGQLKEAVIVYVKLSDDELGVEEDDDPVYALGFALYDLLEESRVGWYDGYEFGAGYARLFLYGPSADRLFDAVIDTIRGQVFPPSSFVVKQYGRQDRDDVRIDL